MSDETTVTEAREQREGWALDERHMPSRVTGYACASGYWWCPRIGYSIPASGFFASEAEARDAAIQELTRERRSIRERLASLGVSER